MKLSRGISIFGVALALVSCADQAEVITKQRLPDFNLKPGEYGWEGRFPGSPQTVFGKEIRIQIDTREVPDDPVDLPPVSATQANLIAQIRSELPAILEAVEQAMIRYNDLDPEFREFVSNPHVWLDSEAEDGKSWAFVIERSDHPDFGYHIEFSGTNFVEIWAGD